MLWGKFREEIGPARIKDDQYVPLLLNGAFTVVYPLSKLDQRAFYRFFRGQSTSRESPMFVHGLAVLREKIRESHW
ncbi:hypothetical protein C484_05172 [Natrialba taiwanensis DSM 12281]|uniref:Uncharacterized protein n=1 Tax=Natrialba taiwanensis DSM 12281 TaxID=1230458 RepID=M0ABQ9_9EURY|nr:hypothetical protein C484_05172 [Natrialba taiwanensis DSM 12281]